MKKPYVSLFSLLLISVSGCFCMIGHPIKWKYLTALGGVKIGEPQSCGAEEWIVPIEYDLSGLTTIQNPPTTLNSFPTYICYIKTTHASSNIYISCFKGNVAKRALTNFKLRKISPGKYNLYYRDQENTIFIQQLLLK